MPDKLDEIKIKAFFSPKDIIEREKANCRVGKKKLVVHISGKDLDPELKQNKNTIKNKNIFTSD